MLQSSVENLTGWLQKEETDLALCRILCQYLMAQVRRSSMECNPPTHLHGYTEEHNQLGLYNFLEGRIYKSLLDSQQEYHENNLQRYKLLCWGKGLIQRVLQITHQQ